MKFTTIFLGLFFLINFNIAHSRCIKEKSLLQGGNEVSEKMKIEWWLTLYNTFECEKDVSPNKITAVFFIESIEKDLKNFPKLVALMKNKSAFFDFLLYQLNNANIEISRLIALNETLKQHCPTAPKWTRKKAVPISVRTKSACFRLRKTIEQNINASDFK